MSVGTEADKRLKRALSRSVTEVRPIPPERIVKLCRAASPEDRLLALVLVQEEIKRRGPQPVDLEAARRLVTDPEEICRWQALFVIGEFVEDDPEAVWGIVEEYGTGEDAAMRSAVATALLERLLDRHYGKYFPRIASRVREGDRNMTDTLRRCWVFGGAKRHSREVDRLLQSVDGHP